MSISNNNKNLPIGFFDSGIGGLTVLNKVKTIMPNEDFIYYGDTIHMPYGEKSKEQLLEYSNNIFKFFESLGCKSVVMACNTTSSVIYNDVKDMYDFKLFPIVQSVSEMLSMLPIKKLGIFATRATIESLAYQREIKKYNPNIQVFGQYCSDWVHIVENNSMNETNNINIVKNDLENMLANSPDRIVLGCTHYPYLLEVLTKFAPKDLFIDPAVMFAQYIKNELEKDDLLKLSNDNGSEKFYVSSNPEHFVKGAKMFYDVKTIPELVTF